MSITHLDCLNLAHWLHNKASEDGLGPICFAIVDAQGDLIWFERMDNAPAHTAHTAIAKAYTSLRMNQSTSAFKQHLEREGLTLNAFMDTQLTSIPGGSPLLLADQVVVGALGISGHRHESDQLLAEAAATYLNSL